jgi:hypothetical protein
MNGWASSSIDALNLRYTGAGVSPATPTAIVFNNELYISFGSNGDSYNTKIAYYDRKRAWSIRDLDVTFMCRYKNSLYGGGSWFAIVSRLDFGYETITLDSNYSNVIHQMTAISKEDLLGSIELQKDIYKIYVVYKKQTAGTFTFSYRLDNFIDPLAEWHSTTVDQTVNGFIDILVGKELCRSIQFKVESAVGDISNNVEIVGWVVLYSYVNVR